MSYSVTLIPQLPEGIMVRGVSSCSLFLNLSTPSYGGNTSEAMEDSSEGLSKYKRSSLGISSMICTILFVAYSSLFGNYSWRMMNAPVSGLPLLATRKYFATCTSPSTLSLCHVFVHFSLIRVEGCSIWVISVDLSPFPGSRRTVSGIVFCQFSQFFRFCGVWSGPSRIIRTILFLWMKPG